MKICIIGAGISGIGAACHIQACHDILQLLHALLRKPFYTWRCVYPPPPCDELPSPRRAARVVLTLCSGCVNTHPATLC